MPEQLINGARLHVDDVGQDEETILFCHGLLFSGRMFDDQVAALQDRYRCVRLDFRGQGRSEVTRDGYDLDTLAADVIELIESMEIGPCHLVGFSMGGMVGLRVALRRPSLLKSLVLMNTSAEAENPRKRPRFTLLNLAARLFGLKFVAPRIMDLLFSSDFLSAPEHADARQRWTGYVLANDRIGVTRAVRGVVGRSGLLDRIDQIRLPTLIVTSDQDTTTPPARAEAMHRRIKDSRLVRIEGAGHMSVAEKPDAVTHRLGEFLGGIQQAEQSSTGRPDRIQPGPN